MRGFYLINYIRTIPVLLICLALKINEIIEEDLKRNLWYIGSADISLSSLNKNLLRNKCFRNIVYYRIHDKNKGLSLIFQILYPIKQDLEIYGQITPPHTQPPPPTPGRRGPLTIYHGHGTVVNLYKAGKNLSVYQGVTIGNKGNGSRSEITPTIGDNVSICANATVIGGIKIGNNVVIGAGSVVTKDVPDNCVAYGNPAVLKKR